MSTSMTSTCRTTTRTRTRRRGCHDRVRPAREAWVTGVVDGVDLDAVAAAVRGCGAVDDLYSGSWGGVVSYLPGRQVTGVRVAPDHVVISVRGRWGVPVTELARQVRAALAGLAGPRRIDIVIADLGEPVPESAALPRWRAPRRGELVDDDQAR